MTTTLTIYPRVAPIPDALDRLKAAGVPDTVRLVPFNPDAPAGTWGLRLSLTEATVDDITAALTVGWVMGVIGVPMTTGVEFEIERTP